MDQRKVPDVHRAPLSCSASRQVRAPRWSPGHRYNGRSRAAECSRRNCPVAGAARQCARRTFSPARPLGRKLLQSLPGGGWWRGRTPFAGPFRPARQTPRPRRQRDGRIQPAGGPALWGRAVIWAPPKGRAKQRLSAPDARCCARVRLAPAALRRLLVGQRRFTAVARARRRQASSKSPKRPIPKIDRRDSLPDGPVGSAFCRRCGVAQKTDSQARVEALIGLHHAQAPTVLDHARALPQGDGRAWPAFAGGAVGGERRGVISHPPPFHLHREDGLIFEKF